MRYFVVLILASVFLIGAGKKNRRHHAAHEHGVATVDIIVEGKTASIDVKSPSEGFFGFEHKATSDKDKKTVEEQTAKLKEKAGELVKFDAELGCISKVEDVKTFVDEHDHSDKKAKHDHDHAEGGTHSETHAKIMVQCEKTIANTKIGFGFTSVFPRIKRIKVQLLSATTQVGKTISEDEGNIQL